MSRAPDATSLRDEWRPRLAPPNMRGLIERWAPAPSPRASLARVRLWNAQGKGNASCFSVGEGLFLTNAHVVEDKDDLRISLIGPSGEEVPARSLGVSPSCDIALISAPLRLPPLAFANGEEGEEVRAWGFPSGEFKVSAGRVLPFSLPEGYGAREVPPPGPSALLRISAEISEGASGGPVVNARGEVVGVSQLALRLYEGPSWIAQNRALARALLRPSETRFYAIKAQVASRAKDEILSGAARARKAA